MSAFHDLTLKALNGEELPLAPFKGQVVLVVNVASKCGLTPQYKALENLYQSTRTKASMSWACRATSSPGKSRAAKRTSRNSAASTTG